MAFTPNTLVQLFGGPIEGNANIWLYVSADPLSSVLGPAYFSDGGKRGMQVGDIVWVMNQTAVTTTQCIVSAVASTSLGGTLTQNTSATVSLGALSSAGLLSNPRNLLDGGEATIAPWQRGTSFSNIGATNTYTADRWFMVGGAGTSATMTKTAQTGIPGFSQAFVFGRGQSSGSVSAVVLGQALESLDSIRTQGQLVTFSFWAAANTGFAAGVSNSTVTVKIEQGFGTDQSASALVNGTWTSQADVVNTTLNLTTTLTRYSFSGVVSNTATQLGVLFSYTPTATTATTAENIIANGFQLEVGPLTPYEHREVEQELAYCQRYFFQAAETGTSGTVLGAGMIAGTNSGVFVLQLPVQMRAAPTVTVTNGSFGANVVGGYVALTGMAAGSTHTVNYVSVNGLLTAVSGQAALLISSSATTGKIAVSADL